jgi:hypothetical protein
MNILDIRKNIANYLSSDDLVNFMSIDKIALTMNDYSFWKNKDKYNLNIKDVNDVKDVKELKNKVLTCNYIDNKIDILLNTPNKINLIDNKISFIYLYNILELSNILTFYHPEETFINLLNYYDLDDKSFNELYLSFDNTHYTLQFIVPDDYLCSLKSYSWSGIKLDEIKIFLLHFLYGIKQ